MSPNRSLLLLPKSAKYQIMDGKKIPFKEMLSSAGILADNIKILPASSINETLSRFELDSGKGDNEKEIEIDILKIVCLTPFIVADETPPKTKIGDAESVLTHIRNAFAHGNTYFFDNGNMMLEDKNNGNITARIIIKRQTLLDWIFIIDKDKRYYIPIHTSQDKIIEGTRDRPMGN